MRPPRILRLTSSVDCPLSAPRPRWVLQPVDQPQQRSFARARGADDDRDRAGINRHSTRHRRAGAVVRILVSIVRSLSWGLPWEASGSRPKNIHYRWPPSGQRDLAGAEQDQVSGGLFSPWNTKSPKSAAPISPQSPASRFLHQHDAQDSQITAGRWAVSTRHKRCPPSSIPRAASSACAGCARTATCCDQTGSRRNRTSATKAGAKSHACNPMRTCHRGTPCTRPQTEQRSSSAETWRAMDWFEENEHGSIAPRRAGLRWTTHAEGKAD